MTAVPSYLSLESPQVEITVTDDDLRRMARQASTAVVLRTGLVLIVLVAICVAATALALNLSIRVAFGIVPASAIVLFVLLKLRCDRSLYWMMNSGRAAASYRLAVSYGPDHLDYADVDRSVARLLYSTVTAVSVRDDVVVIYRGRTAGLIPRALIDDTTLARLRDRGRSAQVPGPHPQRLSRPEITVPNPDVEAVYPAADLPSLSAAASRSLAWRVTSGPIAVVVVSSVIGIVAALVVEPLLVILVAIFLPLATAALVLLWFAVKSSWAQNILILLTGGAPGPFYRYTCVTGPDHLDLGIDDRHVSRLYFGGSDAVKLRVFDRVVLVYRGGLVLFAVPRELFDDGALSAMEAAGVKVTRAR
ncbi:hypothetical protein C6V83_10610 [Gordonia iterans]|uniref:Uncharacterized protein n=1 Tax=Gordonia iterans TaxID=1004901 RepID=A0A2S0KG51_9ACTN|nr:hypothetical protein [Gordonia iterans]AVM00655.1 hypothetical protein C6V83_10610 [Gordonia iterans]